MEGDTNSAPRKFDLQTRAGLSANNPRYKLNGSSYATFSKDEEKRRSLSNLSQTSNESAGKEDDDQANGHESDTSTELSELKANGKRKQFTRDSMEEKDDDGWKALLQNEHIEFSQLQAIEDVEGTRKLQRQTIGEIGETVQEDGASKPRDFVICCCNFSSVSRTLLQTLTPKPQPKQSPQP